MSYRDIKISEELKSCHNKEDLKRLYPECKVIDGSGKSSHTFFELEKDLFCKVYFRLKTGESMKGVFSCKMNEIDYTVFDIESMYVTNGTHKDKE